MSSIPADVVGIIATYLEPTTAVQLPLMLVNHTWLQGAATQIFVSSPPARFRIHWPWPALQQRDPAVLTLENGTAKDVAQLVEKMPRLKAIHLVDANIEDTGLQGIGKLKLLTRLKLHFKYGCIAIGAGGRLREVAMDSAVTNAGMKHLRHLRHLTSLSLRKCHEVSELPLEDLESLTSLDFADCGRLTDLSVLPAAAKMPNLTTLHLGAPSRNLG